MSPHEGGLLLDTSRRTPRTKKRFNGPPCSQSKTAHNAATGMSRSLLRDEVKPSPHLLDRLLVRLRKLLAVHVRHRPNPMRRDAIRDTGGEQTQQDTTRGRDVIAGMPFRDKRGVGYRDRATQSDLTPCVIGIKPATRRLHGVPLHVTSRPSFAHPKPEWYHLLDTHVGSALEPSTAGFFEDLARRTTQLKRKPATR